MLQQGSLSDHTMALAHLRAKSRNDQRTSMSSASSRSLVTYDKTDFSCWHPSCDRDLRFPKAGGSFRENHVANQKRRHRNAIVALPANYFYRPLDNTSCLPNRLPEPRPSVPYQAITLFATRYRRYSVYISQREICECLASKVLTMIYYTMKMKIIEQYRIVDTEYVRDCSSSYERDQSHGAFSSFWPVLYQLVRSYGHFSMYYFAHTTRERERELVVYSARRW